MVVWLAALGLFVHGLLHVVGFEVPWRYAGITELAAGEAAGGRVQLGERAARVLGLIWLLVAILFMVSALGLILSADWALALIGAAAVASLPLCLAKLPEMAIGAVIDVIILVVVVPILFTGSPLLG
jgi:hypothetical protein